MEKTKKMETQTNNGEKAEKKQDKHVLKYYPENKIVYQYQKIYFQLNNL